jgi:hypothetical protein
VPDEIEAVRFPREEFFQEFLNHLTIPFLKPIAEGFFENIRQVEALITMPLMMFSMLEVTEQIDRRLQNHALDYWSKGLGLKNFFDDFHKVVPYSPAQDPDFIERTRKRFDDTLKIPTCGDALRTSIQVLNSAAVSGCWTALECLATDLWVTSLNEEPLLLGQVAISSLESQEPGELSARQIPVGLAARYGFDLRHCLGTVLKTKFDFTGVVGIQKAYKVFVPNDDFIEKVLANPVLSEMEATRHVIVHRAGKVDEDYRKRTKSNAPLGTVLIITEGQVEWLSQVSAHTGIGLLAFVNDWFVAKKAAI